MEFTLRPADYETWVKPAVKKILNTIKSCETSIHLEAAQKMVDNFIVVTAMEDIESSEIEDILNLFWIRLKTQKILIQSNG